jgi:threonine dehydrogenase-like Zn-dependent dehydrogenase
MHCQKMGALGRTSAGAFSGTVTVPEDCLYSIDPSIIDVAVLTDPYAVILHGMNLLKHVPGRLAIIGDGIIAQLFLLESIRLKTRVTNCTVFVKDASRIKPMRTLMDKLGADSSYECKTLSDILPDKYDTVIETVGRAQADTINSAIKLAVPRGSIISYGVYPPGYYASIDIRQLLYKEVQLVGSNSFIADEFEQAVSIVQRYSAMFRLLLGESFSSVDLSAAFTAASLKKPGTIPKKIIVTYDV